MFGGNSTDQLFGGWGADTLSGNNNDDLLLGEGGADTLLGGGGMDTLTGGNGNDLLSGGANPDVFVFGRNDGNDTVTDFTNGLDRLDLSAMGFTSFGNLSANATISSFGRHFDADCIWRCALDPAGRVRHRTTGQRGFHFLKGAKRWCGLYTLAM